MRKSIREDLTLKLIKPDIRNSLRKRINPSTRRVIFNPGITFPSGRGVRLALVDRLERVQFGVRSYLFEAIDSGA